MNEMSLAGTAHQGKSETLRRSLKKLASQKWLYLFLLPAVAYFLIFSYYPTYGLIIAFKDFKPSLGILQSPWIGFANFKILFESDSFLTAFRNSIVLNVYRLLWSFPAPILLAIFLNEVRRPAYKKISQTIVYLPHFISWVIVAGMALSLFSSSDGVVNVFLKNMRLPTINFLGSIKYFRSTLIGVEIWKNTGWGSIIYLAALTGIDPQLYEAAVVDGAGRFKRILHITLPGISSTIAVMLILRTGSLMKAGFEQILLLYNPMVYDVADVLETFAYRTGIQQGRFGYATAIGVFQSAISLVLVLSANKISRKISGQGLY